MFVVVVSAEFVEVVDFNRVRCLFDCCWFVMGVLGRIGCLSLLLTKSLSMETHLDP